MKNFIGFSTLENFIAALNTDLPVYATLTCELIHTSPRLSLSTHGHYITCSQQTQHGVHYWRWRVATTQSINGDMVGDDNKSRIDAAIGAFDIVLRQLRAVAPTVINAIIAFPKNYKYLDGYTELFRYDSQTKHYVPTLSHPAGQESECPF